MDVLAHVRNQLRYTRCRIVQSREIRIYAREQIQPSLQVAELLIYGVQEQLQLQ